MESIIIKFNYRYKIIIIAKVNYALQLKETDER